MIPFPRPLRRRSSWPSSFVTALIGWNGFATVAALAFGRAPLLPAVLQAASACAVLQVLALRAVLRFGGPAGVAGGAVAGAATALALVPLAVARVPALAVHRLVYQQALLLETPGELEARVIETAAAELDALLAASAV